VTANSLAHKPEKPNGSSNINSPKTNEMVNRVRRHRQRRLAQRIGAGKFMNRRRERKVTAGHDAVAHCIPSRLQRYCGQVDGFSGELLAPWPTGRHQPG
jgi:hypothetical protein